MRRLEHKKEYLYYTCAFLICVAILVIPFLTHQRTFIHGGDPTFQHYPAFLYTGRYLQGLLRGEFHLYDFSIGYGEDIIEALNYYGFGDPLNLFSIFVTDSNAAFLFSFLIFVRLYLAGIGMIRFFHYHRENGALVIGGALAYVFSVFAIGQGLWFYSFLNPMYLLPFLLVQLEKLMYEERKRKDWIWFAFLIAVQSCCGFYFLYFQTFFLGIYWLAVCLEQRRENLFRMRIEVFFRYIVSSYLVGIFLSAPILFPALHGFFHSARTSGGASHGDSFFLRRCY